MNEKKSKFLFKTFLFINIFFITLQILAMESYNLGLEIPIVILFTPVLCLY